MFEFALGLNFLLSTVCVVWHLILTGRILSTWEHHLYNESFIRWSCCSTVVCDMEEWAYTTVHGTDNAAVTFSVLFQFYLISPKRYRHVTLFRSNFIWSPQRDKACNRTFLTSRAPSAWLCPLAKWACFVTLTSSGVWFWAESFWYACACFCNRLVLSLRLFCNRNKQ
jgi:hypothetical protein